MPLQTSKKTFTSDLQSLSRVFFDETGTYRPDVKTVAKVTVIGGGGQGGMGLGNLNGGTYASGGGAGGCCQSILTLNKGVSYTAVAGALYGLGSGISTASAPTGATGQTGNQSTFSGPDIPTMTANGGAGGTGGGFGSSTNATATGGAGGTASGGNVFNRTGGPGGDATIFGGATDQKAAAGGGCIQLFVDPSVEVLSGADCTQNAATTAYMASGGAQVLGAAPDVVGSSSVLGNGGKSFGLRTYSTITYLENMIALGNSVGDDTAGQASDWGNLVNMTGSFPEDSPIIVGKNGSAGSSLALNASNNNICATGGTYVDNAANATYSRAAGPGCGSGGNATEWNNSSSFSVYAGIGGGGMVIIEVLSIEI